VLPDDLSLSQIERVFQLGNSTLHLSAGIIRKSPGAIEGLLFTVTDATELISAQKTSRLRQTLIEILQSKEAFQTFLEETSASLKSCREALGLKMMKRVRRELHTIKGNAFAFGLEDLGNLIHKIESLDAVGSREFERIEQQLIQFLTEHEGILGLVWGTHSAQHVSVLHSQLRKIQALSNSLPPSPQCQELCNELEMLDWKPFGSLMGPLKNYGAQLAQRLGKSAKIEVTGENIRVDSQRIAKIVAAMIHPLRNALDHGIETPDERGTKPTVGSIFIGLEETADAWTLSLKDDGRGVDVDAVATKAIAKGLLDEHILKKLTPQKKLELVFSGEISTADIVSDVSGRGVGVAAYRDSVLRCGGQLQLLNTPGQGFEVVATIPKKPSQAMKKAS
jgi:chemotaxis protein histidine kinase CheA